MELMRNARVTSPPEVVIEDAEMVVLEAEGVDFQVVNFRGKDFEEFRELQGQARDRQFWHVKMHELKLSPRYFRWQRVLRRGTPVSWMRLRKLGEVEEACWSGEILKKHVFNRNK